MGSKKPKISNKPRATVSATNIEKIPTQLNISFKYLTEVNNKYSMELITDNKLRLKAYGNLLSKLEEYSQYDNFKKYISENGRYRDRNHIHPIDWSDSKIREKSFSSLSSELMEQISDECWQLGITSEFRIHGFFIDNVFYVVWLDPLHQLYESK